MIIPSTCWKARCMENQYKPSDYYNCASQWQIQERISIWGEDASTPPSSKLRRMKDMAVAVSTFLWPCLNGQQSSIYPKDLSSVLLGVFMFYYFHKFYWPKRRTHFVNHYNLCLSRRYICHPNKTHFKMRTF